MMSNTLYLVTGAAGFLGSNVCRQLLERGEKVRVLVLPNDPAIKYIPKEVEVNEFDPDKVVGWYSRTKAMATQEVLNAVKNRGLNACVVHPSGILGPNDYAVGETTGTIIQIINGEMPVGMQFFLTCVMFVIWQMAVSQQLMLVEKVWF